MTVKALFVRAVANIVLIYTNEVEREISHWNSSLCFIVVSIYWNANFFLVASYFCSLTLEKSNKLVTKAIQVYELLEWQQLFVTRSMAAK